MPPLQQLSLFTGHLGWIDEAALASFPDFVGDFLATNPNIAPARISAIVRQVRKLAEDVVMVSHR